MAKYFNVNLEFNHEVVDKIIQETIELGGKGYVCSVERNIMATANQNSEYNRIINSALVNICDGNFVARTIGWAYKKRFSTYIGADLFIKYINKRKYKQYFLGNTTEVLDALKKELTKIDPLILEMPFVTLPFKDVKNFDYEKIAREINNYKPEIIWVSLGAPKQEEFMYLLQPYLNSGVMFGFGAIFNFYSGLPGQKRAPKLFLELKLEWLYRIFQDPHKNIIRNWNYLQMVPFLIKNERRKLTKK